MPITLHCGTCGAALLESAPGGQCPECLLQLGLAAALPEHSDAPGGKNLPLLRSFGDYELIEEIARGGMGVVFKARQISLNRVVAVKMILAGHFAGPDSVRRFRTEAEATARLHHPNIVAIHEIGEHDGQQFFSMDYIEGHNLAEVVREKPMAAKRAAALLQRVAEAIHYAHGQGLLHRDLKPSNILLDANDQPHVTDFGLAKRLDSDSDLITGHWSVTVTGQVIGSPNYISPEQASGRRRTMGPTTDVYALGAVLCHLLTGRAPFIGETLTDILEQVLHKDPVSPRLLNPAVPRDLETICLKCLEKEPTRRYATAQELADELDRFLKDEPILARPVSRVEKAWRWCRRKPALAGLCAATVVLLLAVAIGSPIAAYRINRSREQAVQAGRRTQRNLVAQYVDNGTRLMNEGDLFGSLLWYAEALRLDAGSPEREEPHRIRIASVLRQCPKLRNVFAHGTMLYHARFSPDGKHLVTASDDHTARVWDVDTGRLLLVLQHQDEVFDAVFSADGQRIVTASKDNTARVWDAKTGAAVTPALRHGDAVWSACFSPDGRLVATGGSDGIAQLWNATTGEKAGSPIQFRRKIMLVSFSPDGRLLCVEPWGDWEVATVAGLPAQTAKWDHRNTVWEVATGKLLFSGVQEGAMFDGLKFSPDSRRFLAWDGALLHVWDPATAKPCSFSPLKHQAYIRSAAFSPDGRNIVSAADDNTIAVWDAATGQPVFSPPIRREDYALQVIFSPDGRRVLAAGEDKIARVWNARTGRPVCPPLKHILMVKQCAFNPDGRRLLSYSCDQAGRVWDLATSEIQTPPTPVLSEGWGIRSSDGSRMLLRATNNAICVAEVSSGQVLCLLPHEFPVTFASFSPDGRTVVTACTEPNAVSSTRNAIFLWEAATARHLNRTPMETGFSLNCVAFSDDGTRIVTGGLDFTARVWDARDGRPLTGPMRQRHQVVWAGFSPDGRSVVASCWDNTARVWDVATGQPLTALMQHKDRVCGAAWSADGRRLETLTRDGHKQTWDLANSEPLTPPRRTSKLGGSREDRPPLNSDNGLRNSDLNQNLLTSAAMEEMLPDSRPVEDLVSLARMLAVGRIDAGGNLVPLELNELRDAWATLRQKYPKQFAPTPEEIAAWHQREAADCLADGDWEPSLFHFRHALEFRPDDAALLQQCSELEAALRQPAGVNLRRLEQAHQIPARDPRAQPEQLDLSAYYNLPLGDGMLGKPDGEDLGSLRPGLRTFGLIPFDVRGLVHLSSQSIKARGEDLPEQVDGIKVGRKCRRLHFLQAASDWVKHGVLVGSYVLHYVNGEQRELPLIYGRDIGRSWGQPRLPSQPGAALVVWTGNDPLVFDGNSTQRVYKSTRDNPLPDVEVVSIDFRSTMTKCAPFLVALTVE